MTTQGKAQRVLSSGRTKLHQCFSMTEYLSIKEMVLALWEVDVDELEIIWVGSQAGIIIVPIMKDTLMEPPFPGGPIRQPRFYSCVIDLNRWLLPWRLKAGYDPQYNILAIQEHPNG